MRQNLRCQRIFFCRKAGIVAAVILLVLISFSGCENKRAPHVTSLEFVQKSVPAWAENAAIYEVNIRQYSAEGSFAAFKTDLPRLKELGVKILWLMPIQPIGVEKRKGSLGSYYSIRNYSAVNPEFGTLNEFKELVNTAHEMGMYVILDWVANHSAWDHPWVGSNPEFYTRDSSGAMQPPVADWHDVADLNYENHELRAAMIEEMAFWVRETNIDGFRCDVAEMVPLDFWRAARKSLDDIKPMFMLAEGAEPSLHEAFDMTYSWKVHHMMNKIASGDQRASDLAGLIIEEIAEFPENAYRMQFTSNHDENSWNGTVFERLGKAVETFAMLSLLIPDMPLIYNGQEAGMAKRLAFFEKDQIDWQDHPLFERYKVGLALKNKNKGLWNGTKGGQLKMLTSNDDDNIFSFARERQGDGILAIFNLSNSRVNAVVSGHVQPGEYRGIVTDENIEIQAEAPLELNLKPWGYRIYEKL